MALSTKAIKQKIKSVGNIKKITKTMEMVSVSKMRKSVDKALSSRSYSSYALELLVNLSKSRAINHPSMNPGKENKELIIIIAGNKGLCGGYNSNVLRALNAYLHSLDGDKKIKSITIGKYAEKIGRKLGLENFASFTNFSEDSTIDSTRELLSRVYQEYIEGGYSSTKIIYTEFLKSTTYKPIMREIFPISVGSFKNIIEVLDTQESQGMLDRDFSNYIFEPSVSEILNSILPGLVDSVIYQTLAESFASEHSARMFAMKNAGDNATAMLDDLVLSYNHARQDGITKELSEIVAGAEALSS